jgi:hypothetical protein
MTLIDVVAVQVTDEYQLLLTFENQEQRLFDMRPFIETPPWNRLKHGDVFRKVRIQQGTVVWPGQIDIDPETLYELSKVAKKTVC